MLPPLSAAALSLPSAQQVAARSGAPLAAENLIAANGMLYVNTHRSFNEPAPTNDLYALDARTGLALWHIRVPGGEVFGSPQIADGTLFLVAYMLDQGGSVYALNPRTGAECWHSQAVVGRFSSAPPVAVEGRIYFAPTNMGSLYALDSATGAEVWHYQAALEGEEFHICSRKRSKNLSLGTI